MPEGVPNIDDIRLDGLVAAVTGAAGVIGAATARALAGVGCDVALCDLELEGLAATARDVEALGREQHAEVLDGRDAEATTSWLTGAAAVLGPLDVVVTEAVAGVSGVVRAALPLLSTDGASIIVVMSSMDDPDAGVGSLAMELAPHHVRVNAVAPRPDGDRAAEVAATVVWLASPLARSVTGTVVHV